MIALYILFLISFAALSLWRLSWGLSVFLILLPSYLIRLHIAGIPTTFLELLFVVLFLCFLCHIWLERKNISDIFRTPFSLPLALLWIAGIIGIIASPVPLSALGLFRAYIVEPTLFFFILLFTLHDEKTLRHLSRGLVLLGIWVSSLSILQFFRLFPIPLPYGTEIPQRLTSVFPYPNAVALLLTPIFLFLSVSLLKTEIFQKKERRLVALSLLPMAFALFGSVSEGAFAAVMAVLCLVFFTTRFRKIVISGILISVLIIMAVPGPRHYVWRLVSFQDTSGDVRLALWQGTWNMLQHRPLTGAGLSGFPFVYPEYKLNKHVELLQYAHNIFLDFWSELGILGLIVLLWILTVFFKNIFRLLSSPHFWGKISWPLLAVTIGFIIHGLVDVPYFKNDLAFLFWVWAALLTVALRKLRRS